MVMEIRKVCVVCMYPYVMYYTHLVRKDVEKTDPFHKYKIQQYAFRPGISYYSQCGPGVHATR